MQGALSETSGSSRVSGYNNPEGSTGIGWCDEDSGGWGPPVERWSSVDSWASALSDWAAIITAPPEDLTAAFTEIGAEIDALTQALAEVHADKDTETSEEAEGQQTSLQTRPQPPMGVQDQPLMTQNIPESCVLSGQSCVSLCLEPAGPELQRQRAEHLCDSTASKAEGREPEEIQSSPGESPLRPSQRHSSTGLSSAPVASPGGYSVDAPLIPGATPSADVTLSQSGGYVESLETDIVLNIIEDTDLEGQNPPAELIIGEPSGAGLREVTEEHIISQPGTLSEQEWRRCSEPAKLDGEGTNSSADPDRPPTHTLENLHVPGVNAQPVYVHAQVLPDTLLELDGARQLEPQLESPEFIMPLAPLLCRTSSSLEGDQICAKRSPTDKRDLCCDHVQPCILWPTLDVITDKPPVKFNEELIQKEENTFDSSTEKQLDLQSRKTSECHFTDRKTIIEEIHEFSRELSNLAAVPADHFIISEKDHVAFITLDLNDPFTQSVATTVPSEKAELSQKTAETMPHKTDKNASEGKTRSKKDKSAGHHHHHHHHHGTQASKKQENLSHHVSAQQTCKQVEIHPPTGENHTSETASAGLEDNQAKSGIETCVPSEKAPNKPHGKKKKKHGQNAAAPKSVMEPPAEVVNGAKPKTAKGRIDMFEAKLGAKAEKAQKESGQKDAAERKSEQPEAKVSKKEGPAHQTEHRKDQQPKNSTSPLKDDAIKRRRLSEDKFGKIVSALESKVPKTNVSTKAKATDSKTEAGAIHKKPYSEVVKQKLLPKADPKVVQPIQAVSVSGDPQSLCLWCQFAAVLSDYAVIWSRDATVLTEIKRSAGDESRVSLTISNASHKDLGKYQCRLSSSHGSVSLEYLLTYEVLSEIVIPPSPKTIPSAPEVEVGRDEEDVHCSKLMFKEDFLADQYFGENHPVSISTEKIHFGEGMHRRAFRTKLQAGQMHLLVPGHSCVLKVHNSISYGTKNNEELIQKNFTLAVEECQVQNTARQYIKAYTAAAQSVEAFGDVPEIIPIYLVHRPSNDIPYATLEEELIGDFVKYSVKDGKEINLLRRDSEAGQKCCAFQHWVYHNTEGNLLVTDMQGVGMRLTDVGIATCKKGYKGFKGNCATSFIDQFKALHQCNTYCEILGLKSLQPKAKKPAPKPKPQPSAAPKKKIFGPTVKGKS
ncbi:alpha-protein kinase 2 [Echeneis naucrates]|uniref:alpha-protein kinase 2 n=1 Tax=Echeneis naucrates TaxID=173247 RepID=UPI00111409F6|nr:uncharacterized protein LOC115052378 [Echeneis naucrates]